MIKQANCCLIYLISMTALFLMLSCNHDDDKQNSQPDVFENGVLVKQQELWKADLGKQDNDLTASHYQPIVSNQYVYAPSKNRGDEWDLLGFRISNGQLKWTQKVSNLDYWTFSGNPRDAKDIHLYMGKSFKYLDKGIELVALNLKDGSIRWQHTLRGKTLGEKPMRLGNHFYFHYNPQNEDGSHAAIPVLYKGDVNTGQFEQLLLPKIDSIRLSHSKTYGKIRGITPFKGKNNHDYLLIPFSEYMIEDGPSNTWSWGKLYYSLYNLTTNQYVYEKKYLMEKALILYEYAGASIYQDEVAILNAGDQLTGFDLYTGEILWTNKYDKGEGAFSYQMVGNTFVAAQRYGGNAYCYGINPKTGQELWRVKTRGGCESMAQLNGVVYWNSRADTRLYAIDAATGKLLWRLKDPDPESDSFFKHGSLNVQKGKNGEKGKVFASTYRRLYCYEAAK